MVSCHLESDVEVSPRPARGINVVAMASMSQILMVALLFENHFVVELLWPRRERRARMNPLVVSNIFNALLTIFKIRTRCRVLTRFMFEVNVVAMASMSQTQFQKEYKKFEVRCRVLTRFMFEVNVVAMASMSQTQISL